MWAEDIEATLDEIDELIDDLKLCKGSAKNEKIAECDSKISIYESLFRSFNIEFRALTGSTKAEFKTRRSLFLNRVNEYKIQIKFNKSTDERANLMAGASKEVKDPTKMTGDELLSGALKTQDDTRNALKRITGIAADTKEIGLATGAELAGQTEALNNITDSLNQIDDDLTKSNKLIRAFGIRMMTDRCIRIFLFILTIGFAAIIVLAVIMPEAADKAGFNVPDELKPPTASQVADDANSVKDVVTNAARMLRG